MSRSSFVAAGEPRWREIERLTRKLAAGRAAAGAEEFPALYRRACADLALAQHRGYGTALVETLNTLVLRAHHVLYASARPRGWMRVVEFAAVRFPRTVRAEWRVVLLATVVFVVPFVGMIVTTQRVPEAAYLFLDSAALEQMEEMHGSSRGDDGHGSGLAGFAFYLMHNGSIAFRTFAGGMFAGVGTLVILLYNALVLGAVFGHLNRVGLGENINSFAIGHGAFELTAIVLAAAAGLKLGLALFRPGALRVGDALRVAGRPAGVLIGGAGLMIGVAAAIEAGWSPGTASARTKYFVGAALWLAVVLHLVLGGRVRRGA